MPKKVNVKTGAKSTNADFVPENHKCKTGTKLTNADFVPEMYLI